MSKVIDLNYNEVINTIKNSGKILGNFEEFNKQTEELKYAYEKFRFNGNINKPLFEEVYESVKEYISKFIINK